MLRIKDYQATIDRIKIHLVEYLEEHGIRAAGGKHFKCFNPNNHDTDGDDMSVHPDGHVFHCFGCGLTGNIMLAAHHLENKPINGPGYIPENVLYLGRKFGVEVEFEELTEADKYELDIYRSYADAARKIAADLEGSPIEQATKNRGWTLDLCRRYQVGTVQDFGQFFGQLKKKYSVKFLKDVDLHKTSIFNKNAIVFTIHDAGGSPVGFAARNLLYEEQVAIWSKNGRIGRKPPKYVNITTSGTHNIYDKSSRLYGLHQYLRTRQSSDDPLYIVEGYSDVLTLAQHDVGNAAALCGTAFTRKHLATLRKADVRHIILAYDGDQAGQDSAARLLLGKEDRPGVLSGVANLKIEVMQLPEGTDPDSLVKEKGAKAFTKLDRIDAFQFVLNQFEYESDPVEVCRKTIPLIIGEDNLIRRDQMCEILAEATGISPATVKDELSRVLSIQEADLSAQREEIVRDALREAARDPESSVLILQTAQSRIDSLGVEQNESAYSVAECVSALDALKEEQESDDGLAGFKLNHFKDIEMNMNGNWMEDVLIVIGGKANTGKTALMSGLALDLVQSNEDAIVIFHTIDDTRGMIVNRWITQLALPESTKHGLDITINKMAKPRYFMTHVNHSGEHDNLLLVRNEAFKRLRGLMSTGRLVVKGHDQGRTLQYAQSLVAFYRKEYPDKKIVYFLDNFHKLADWGHLDERIKFKRMSEFMKYEIAVRHHVTAVCTMEYHKIPPLVRPNNNSLAESVSMEFDANFIGHLYCEVDEFKKAKGDASKAQVFHGCEGGIGEKRPTVELIWGKNKITDFKGTTYYDFHPEKSLYVPVDVEVVRQRHLEEEEANATTWVQGKRVPVGAVKENLSF